MKTQHELLMSPQISKQQFFKKMIECLKGQFFQTGAIECMNPARLKVKYVWGYQYTGIIDGMWSGQLNADHQVSLGNKKVEVKRGTTVSSSFDNLRFNIVLPCIPKNEEHLAAIGQRLKETGQFFSLDNINLIPYDEAAGIPAEDIVGDLTESPVECWQACCNTVTDRIGIEYAATLGSSLAYILDILGKLSPQEVSRLISLDTSFSQQYLENFNVTTRNTLEIYGNKVLIPYYVLDFDCNGDNYYLLQFADGSEIAHCVLPLRRVRVPEEQVAIEMPDKVKNANLLKWGWVLSILVFIILDFVSALVYLAIWGGAYWYLGKPIRDRKAELERIQNENENENVRMLSEQWGII